MNHVHQINVRWEGHLWNLFFRWRGPFLRAAASLYTVTQRFTTFHWKCLSKTFPRLKCDYIALFFVFVFLFRLAYHIGSLGSSCSSFVYDTYAWKHLHVQLYQWPLIFCSGAREYIRTVARLNRGFSGLSQVSVKHSTLQYLTSDCLIVNVIKHLIHLIVHQLNVRQQNSREWEAVLILISASCHCIFPVFCSVATGNVMSGTWGFFFLFGFFLEGINVTEANTFWCKQRTKHDCKHKCEMLPRFSAIMQHILLTVLTSGDHDRVRRLLIVESP